MHLNTSIKTYNEREAKLGDLAEKSFFYIEKGERNEDRWDTEGDGIAKSKITEVKAQFRHIFYNCFGVKYVVDPNAKGYNNFKKCIDLNKRLVFVEMRMDNNKITYWEVPKQNKNKFFKYWNPAEQCTMAGWKIKDFIKIHEVEHKEFADKMKELSTANKDFLIRNTHKIID